MNKTSIENIPGLPDGIFGEMHGKQYVAHWTYRNELEETVGHVVRYETGSGEKAVLPYFKKEADKWKPGYSTSLKHDQPLYNLDKITSAPQVEEIYITEDEKCCDALTKLGFLATTSPRGASSAHKANWEVLSDRKVIIWPDNDPVKMNLSRIINLWDKLYGDTDVKVSEIVADCNKAIENKDTDSDEFELAQIFLEATRSRARTLDGRLIGIWLRSNKEGIQDGYKIVPSPWSKKSSVHTWILERVK